MCVDIQGVLKWPDKDLANLNDGGPAFPTKKTKQVGILNVIQCEPGMSLRDWFAGKALAGMCASAFWCENAQAEDPVAIKALADSALAVADAMLKAREK